MACPRCGWTNQVGVKFCTRCGLNVASSTTPLSAQPVVDERMVKVIKDYYKGRRDTVTGAVLIPAGLLIMAILVAAGMPPIASFFIICWMFFWGASALASGLGKWLASSEEMKALGYGIQQQQQQHNLPQQSEPVLPPASDRTTGPTDFPGSVTEQTTRQLDERGYKPRERESK